MIIIYHNPQCSKSRETLALIRQHGVEPVIIECLRHPIDKITITKLLNESGLTAKQAMRTDVSEYIENVQGQSLDESTLITLLVNYPRLLNRPFVHTPKGTALCRPPERVLALL